MMKRQLLVLNLWLLLLPIFSNLGNPTQIQHVVTKTAKDDINPGFISIDCGVTVDYIDTNTGIWYQPDKGYVETGTNHVLSPNYIIDNPYIGKQLSTLRSFPEGNRNCYTLNPKQGKNNNYLIRAFFAYQNYDNRNQVPIFDLYIGAYYWDTINVSGSYFYSEINYTPSTDTIYVCLVNTGLGIPFISSLELRPLNNSIYQTVSTSLPQYLQGRYGVGIPSDYVHFRYKDDVYDRIWNTYDVPDTASFNRSVDVDIRNDAYKIPAQVMTTAVQPLNGSKTVDFTNNLGTHFEYYVYLHFLEIEQLPGEQKRIINITIDDKYVTSVPVSLEYLKPLTVSSKNFTVGYIHFSISATAESDVPPILNAIEVYRITTQTSLPTNTEDVNAILKIKQTYGISKMEWQGDPCVPSTLSWSGLSCSSDNNPRIISLNLSSSKLTGEIATSFLNLTILESLDLSNNELTGPLPEFLAQLPYLKILNLSGNKLTGSIPKALKAKINNKTLQLSLDGNSGFCLKGSCKRKKFVVPLVSSIAALVVITFCSLIIWRLVQRKRQQVVVKEFKEEVFVKLKCRAYSHAEVIEITDNFKSTIGEGGFGKVYFGILKDDTQVAVKLLSLSSKQGYKAFQSEAELLMFLHHRNLVSLMGYCEEGDVKALIYEYMENGNLHQNLSEKAPNVLNWIGRLQIAVDAAHGLDYLHNGCKPPIIHRDLKTSNILLSAKMQAKIADFGLSRTFANDSDSHIITHPAGTPGYLDPQFQISKKSDIYSFGIILFELITGQPAVKQTAEGAIHILHWVIPAIEEGDIINIIDQRLQGNYSFASVQKAIDVAMACVPTVAAQRLDISLVLADLKECLSLEMVHGASSLVCDSQITEIYAR